MLAILCSFFHFIRRFWNQILICRSVRQSACAISILEGSVGGGQARLQRYLRLRVR
jgi:hypothetical protein